MQPQIGNEDVTWSPRYNMFTTKTNKRRVLSLQEAELDGRFMFPHIALETCTIKFNHKVNMSFVFHFYTLELTSWIWTSSLQLKNWNLRALQNETHMRVSISNTGWEGIRLHQNLNRFTLWKHRLPDEKEQAPLHTIPFSDVKQTEAFATFMCDESVVFPSCSPPLRKQLPHSDDDAQHMFEARSFLSIGRRWKERWWLTICSGLIQRRKGSRRGLSKGLISKLVRTGSRIINFLMLRCSRRVSLGGCENFQIQIDMGCLTTVHPQDETVDLHSWRTFRRYDFVTFFFSCLLSFLQL